MGGGPKRQLCVAVPAACNTRRFPQRGPHPPGASLSLITPPTKLIPPLPLKHSHNPGSMPKKIISNIRDLSSRMLHNNPSVYAGRRAHLSVPSPRGDRRWRGFFFFLSHLWPPTFAAWWDPALTPWPTCHWGVWWW